MKVIYQYVLKNFARYFVLCLVVLVFIYVVINLFDNLGKFLAKNVLAQDIMIYYAYLVPSYIVLLIPVASIMAVFFIFGIMTKNKELIALKTSGLNITRLFILIIITGCLLALCSFAFQETIGIWAQTQLFEHKQKNMDRQPQPPPTRRSNFFYHGEGDWVYFVRQFDATRKRLDGVTLWQFKDNRVVQRIDAESGTYDTTWRFSNTTTRHFDTLGNEQVAITAQLDMPNLQETPEDFLKRIKPLEEMKFSEILTFVHKKKRAGEDVAKEEVELNYRFSYPFITIIVLLITLPLSVVLKKGGIAIGLGLSIVLAFVYWGFIQSCRAYGVAGLIDPILAAWLPNTLFTILGIVLILKVPR